MKVAKQKIFYNRKWASSPFQMVISREFLTLLRKFSIPRGLKIDGFSRKLGYTI